MGSSLILEAESCGEMVKGDNNNVNSEDGVVKREKEEKVNEVDDGVLLPKKDSNPLPRPRLPRLKNPPRPQLLVFNALSTLRLLSSFCSKVIHSFNSLGSLIIFNN